MSDAFGPGRWFRGNLHTHSDRSDGVAPPEQVVAEYRAAGYDFLVLTDHYEERWGWTVTDTTPARDDGFTTLLGAELSSADWDDEDVFWVNAIGLPADFAAPHAEAIARAAEAGAYNVLLHPGLTNLLDFDALPLDDLHAVETYNVNAALSWPDQAEGRYAVDALLARGRRLHVTAGDDAHWHQPWDRFGAWVEVRAQELRPDALLAALRERDALLGRTVSWAGGEGVGAGIDEAGALRVRLPGGGETTVTAGEIHLGPDGIGPRAPAAGVGDREPPVR